MFRRTHWILTSPEGPTKIAVRRCLALEVYRALIEYENEKAKLAHYLVQIVDCDDPIDQRQNWIHGDPVHVVTDPALAMAIGFFNIYHQCWALIEKEKTLMHCGNTTFTYSNEFNDYIKVDGAESEDIFDYLFDIEGGKFLSEEGKKYLLELFEEYDPEHLNQINKDFDEYPDNDGLKDIIGDEGMQNLNNDD